MQKTNIQTHRRKCWRVNLLPWVWNDFLTVILKALEPKDEKLMDITTSKLIWDNSERSCQLQASCGSG